VALLVAPCRIWTYEFKVLSSLASTSLQVVWKKLLLGKSLARPSSQTNCCYQLQIWPLLNPFQLFPFAMFCDIPPRSHHQMSRPSLKFQRINLARTSTGIHFLSLISLLALGSVSVVGSIVLIWWFSRSHRKGLVWNLASRWHPYRFCRPYQTCTLVLNPPPLVPQCQDHQYNASAQDLCPRGFEKIPDFRIHPADSALLSWGSPFKNSWYLPWWKTWNTDAGVNDFASHQSRTVCRLRLHCEDDLSIRPKCGHDRFSPGI